MRVIECPVFGKHLVKAAEVGTLVLLLAMGGCRSDVHDAAKGGDLSAVVAFIEDGGVADKQDERGRTALHLAAFRGHLDIVEFLLERGASLSVSDRHLGTPLHFAVAGGQMDVVKRLLRANISTDVPGARGETALDVAVKSDSTAMLRILHAAGADLNRTNVGSQSITPLHRGALLGRTNAVAFLTQEGVEVNCLLVDGKTPLHLCVVPPRERGLAVARLLLAAGADPLLRDKDGCSARDLAEERRKHELAELLKNAESQGNQGQP